MRFLFECVGCCMNSTHESPAMSPAEETRSLVTLAPATTIGCRRKRSPARSQAADWRPSLLAISEDNAIPPAPVMPDNRNSTAPVTGAGSVKRCGPSPARVNVARSYTRHFSHDPLPVVVPAFSAAPFMFWDVLPRWACNQRRVNQVGASMSGYAPHT